jgi:hypothetical protein
MAQYRMSGRAITKAAKLAQFQAPRPLLHYGMGMGMIAELPITKRIDIGLHTVGECWRFRFSVNRLNRSTIYTFWRLYLRIATE